MVSSKGFQTWKPFLCNQHILPLHAFSTFYGQNFPVPNYLIFCLCGTACVFIVGNLFSAPIDTWADGLKSGMLAWLVILGYTIWNDCFKKKEEK